MQNSHTGVYSDEPELEFPSPSGGSGQKMEEYLVKSTQRLQALMEIANRGETLDGNSRDWMLIQVDFITELLGNDIEQLDQETRSNLMQFLLAIANLNEQFRQRASLGI